MSSGVGGCRVLGGDTDPGDAGGATELEVPK